MDTEADFAEMTSCEFDGHLELAWQFLCISADKVRSGLSLRSRSSPSLISQSNNSTDHTTYSEGEFCLPNWALSLHYLPAVWVTAPGLLPADRALMRTLARAPHFISSCLLEQIGTKQLVYVVRCASACSAFCSASLWGLSDASITSTVTACAAAATAAVALWF